MQHFIRRIVRFLLSGAFLTGASIMLLVTPAMGGIASTKHNLSPGGPGPNKVTAGTDELCVFCHTPHAADISAPVPLWNKALPSGAGYQTYASLNSSTIDGEILAVGSISLACLSCHDGTQAMDNVINAPGSGGYDVTGGGPNGLGYTWTGANVDANGKMINSATTLAMLSTDLRNDHPIGIHYCGGGQTAATPAGACVDKDFFAPSTAVINANRVWWVDTSGVGTAGTRDKTDMILYTRTFAAGSGPSVECASCHDPHVDGTGASGQTFLRVANTGSALCLTCHNK